MGVNRMARCGPQNSSDYFTVQYQKQTINSFESLKRIQDFVLQVSIELYFVPTY